MKEFELLIKQSKRLEVKPINSTTGSMGDSYEVGDKIVRIFNKKGRKLMTCTCDNSDRFCNSPTICRHKVRLINYLSYDSFELKLSDLIEQYKSFAINKLPVESAMVFDDLQNLLDKIKR